MRSDEHLWHRSCRELVEPFRDTRDMTLVHEHAARQPSASDDPEHAIADRVLLRRRPDSHHRSRHLDPGHVDR